MPVDVEGLRLSAAERIRDKGFLSTIRRPVYTGDLRTGQLDRTTWMLLESATPRPLVNDAVAGTEMSLVIAALEWDATAGAWLGPLDLKMNDALLYQGRWVTVFIPGESAPSGEPLIYESRVGVRKETA